MMLLKSIVQGSDTTGDAMNYQSRQHKNYSTV
jgi:hypothetical protein